MKTYEEQNMEEAFGSQDLKSEVESLRGQLEQAQEEKSYFESRRGGECKDCGSWVCPPLTCMACLAKLSPEDELRITNQKLTTELEQAQAACVERDETLRRIRDDALAMIDADDNSVLFVEAPKRIKEHANKILLSNSCGKPILERLEQQQEQLENAELERISLSERLEQAEKDKERLDWLESGHHIGNVIPFQKWIDFGWWAEKGDLRTAIDEARKEKPWT